MGKQRDKHPLEDNPFVEDLLDWMGSPEGQRSSEVRDTVWPMLEKADVDAKNRKIIWEDGQRFRLPSPCSAFMHNTRTSHCSLSKRM